MPPLETSQNIEFQERIQLGFRMALKDGVDIMGGIGSVMVKMGEAMSGQARGAKFSPSMLHPKIMLRLMQGWLRAKREGRTLLPKDLWPLKGLACYGMDTSIYREQLIHYWGKEPFESYGATEAGLIACTAWNKRSLTFLPSACFLEFIPEKEWLKNRDNKEYQPSTVLLDEVKPGERYEIVFTSFYGMPFLRYRLGDLIKVVALEDTEAGIKLPQVVFDSRADDIIDIAGFSRLDEKTIWQAIANSGLKFEDWSARKEYQQDEPIIHLYIELKEEIKAAKVQKLIHRQLLSIHPDYRDLEKMLGTKPLKGSLLPAGSFQRYYEKRKKGGADLAHLKPPHMNAADTVIQDLLEQVNTGEL